MSNRCIIVFKVLDKHFGSTFQFDRTVDLKTNGLVILLFLEYLLNENDCL